MTWGPQKATAAVDMISETEMIRFMHQEAEIVGGTSSLTALYKLRFRRKL
jgi:hypothetical protein